jgi:glycosyltransferase involved in cell wall biosynthesis
MLISDQVYLHEDLVRGGGAVVVRRDGAAIAETVRDLLKDDCRLSDMSAAALRTADALFAWDSVARSQSAFRESVVARREACVE